MSNNTVSNSTNGTNPNQALYNEFKLVLSCVVVVMIIFLVFFVYNLIKCYLPKWTAKKEDKGTEENVKEKKAIRTNYSQVELDEV